MARKDLGTLEPMGTAYKCRACGETVIGEEEADRHIEMAEREGAVMPLPTGLVYRCREDKVRVYRIVVNFEWWRHTRINNVVTIDLSAKYFLSEAISRAYYIRDSISKFQSGTYSLLTPEQFEEFKKRNKNNLDEIGWKYDIEELKRTTPELEALVAETAGQVKDRGEAEAGGGG